MGPITHYRSASKGAVAIRDMHETHLANAIAKMEKPGGLANLATLNALRAERDRRAKL